MLGDFLAAQLALYRYLSSFRCMKWPCFQTWHHRVPFSVCVCVCCNWWLSPSQHTQPAGLFGHLCVESALVKTGSLQEDLERAAFLCFFFLSSAMSVCDCVNKSQTANNLQIQWTLHTCINKKVCLTYIKSLLHKSFLSWNQLYAHIIGIELRSFLYTINLYVSQQEGRVQTTLC